MDAHCHVFGPAAAFPYAPERKYTPVDASKHDLFALRDHLGVSRNVIVQATCHGADNSALVDALKVAGGRARGVATVLPRRHRRGAAATARGRGVRFHFVRRLVDAVQPPKDIPHGDRTVILKDPSGHMWVFLTHLEDVSEEELRRRLAAAG
ncbi:amidohydrolase family protein [Streptomyces pratens]|uniref:Amidohydrolase family protein n=1 Tax=Streptomyces pratens TaxID=887456 RepID=A0ABW1LVT7_9ACTN